MKVKIPQTGGAVLSVQGRDRGKYYVVVEVLGDFVLVADGKTRKRENPKKKNVKHLRLLPLDISSEGIVWDKSFDDRVAHYLKTLADKFKSED